MMTSFPPAGPAGYLLCLPVVLAEEGGWADDPLDPGGATQKGVTLAAYRAACARWGRPEPGKDELRAISDADLERVYLEGYWAPSRAGEMPAPVALLVFDAAVNHGLGRQAWRAPSILQRALDALGVLRGGVDGVIGPKTIAATYEADALALIAELAAQRAYTYANLRPALVERFLLGWLRRVSRVAAEAVEMHTRQRARLLARQRDGAAIGAPLGGG